MKTLPAKRNLIADVIKGIAILCVLYGHSVTMINSVRNVTWTDSVMNVFVTAFEMPLFIMVSGYFLHFSLKKGAFSRVLWKRILAVAIPILIWEGIPAIAEMIQKTMANGFSLRSIATVVSHCVFPGKLWFLMAYLICSVILILIEWVCAAIKNPKRSNFVRFFSYISIALLLQFVHLPLSSAQFLFPFFLVGFLLCKYQLLQRKAVRITAAVLAGLFVVLYPFYKAENSFYFIASMSINQLSQLWIVFLHRFLLGICGCCGVYAFVKLLGKWKSIQGAFGKLGSLGEKTMEIYILSMFIQELLRWVCVRILPTGIVTDWTAPLLLGPVFMVVLLLLCLGCDAVIRKLPKVHKYIFGR